MASWPLFTLLSSTRHHRGPPLLSTSPRIQNCLRLSLSTMVGGAEGGEILLLTFRQVGCVLPEDITLLEQIGPSHLVELVARSLWLITDGDAIFDANLPSGMASRHRLCTNLANAVKKLGYTGECGYSQLLYPVGSTTRDILGFLVERLPREEEETQTEMIGPNALLNRRILFSISTWTTVRLRVLLLHLLHPLLPLFSSSAHSILPVNCPTRNLACKRAVLLLIPAPLIALIVPRKPDSNRTHLQHFPWWYLRLSSKKTLWRASQLRFRYVRCMRGYKSCYMRVRVRVSRAVQSFL